MGHSDKTMKYNIIKVFTPPFLDVYQNDSLLLIPGHYATPQFIRDTHKAGAGGIIFIEAKITDRVLPFRSFLCLNIS